jgi:hypothetical protein
MAFRKRLNVIAVRSQKPLQWGYTMKRTAISLFLTALICAAVSAQQFVFIEGDGEWSSSTKTKFEQLGPLPDYNAREPYDYVHGGFFMKYVCKSKPNPEKVVNVQMCMWKPGETCTGGFNVTKTGTYYFKNPQPSVNWCGPSGCPTWTSKIQTILMVHRAERQGGGWLGCGGSHCYKGSDTDQYIPIKFHIKVIMVAQGNKLILPPDWNPPSSWDKHLPDGALYAKRKRIAQPVTMQARYNRSANALIFGKKLSGNEIQIISVSGKQVASARFEPGAAQYRLSGKQLPYGTYLLKTEEPGIAGRLSVVE